MDPPLPEWRNGYASRDADGRMHTFRASPDSISGKAVVMASRGRVWVIIRSAGNRPLWISAWAAWKSDGVSEQEPERTNSL